MEREAFWLVQFDSGVIVIVLNGWFGSLSEVQVMISLVLLIDGMMKVICLAHVS